VPVVISLFKMARLTLELLKYQFFPVSPFICFVPYNWNHFVGLFSDYFAFYFSDTCKER
jgi:hypothetical protein